MTRSILQLLIQLYPALRSMTPCQSSGYGDCISRGSFAMSNCSVKAGPFLLISIQPGTNLSSLSIISFMTVTTTWSNDCMTLSASNRWFPSLKTQQSCHLLRLSPLRKIFLKASCFSSPEITQSTKDTPSECAPNSRITSMKSNSCSM